MISLDQYSPYHLYNPHYRRCYVNPKTMGIEAPLTPSSSLLGDMPEACQSDSKGYVCPPYLYPKLAASSVNEPEVTLLGQ